ncbi:MAG: undecaprenol kinase [Sulfurospirillum sp.]|jgi:diacylglycerol kinase (ATP)|nr:undecaprenol kinase [Sulfurospirillum sp.]DAB35028.1 MAG TPA: diacylglycerol kinase [Sulfurospirillum sp. UBA12182]
MRNKFLETGEHGYRPIQKLKVVFSGLRFAVVSDFSVMYKVVLSIVLLIPILILSDRFNASLIILATGMMLMAEIFNTAIEAMCDYMKSDFDEKIGMIKDVSAAATGVAIFVWIVVMLIEIYTIYSELSKYY